MDPRTLLAFRQIDVLRDLLPEAQQLLAAFSTVRSIRKGETLFCQGEPSPYCFGVLSGEITIVRTSPGGPSAPQVHGKGSLLEGLSLIQEMPRPGLASVSQDGELLSIWSSRFRSWDSDLDKKEVLLKDIRRALNA